MANPLDAVTAAFSAAHPFERATITSFRPPMHVSVARSPEQRARGLVGHGLDGDGMLFVFPRPVTVGFHMRNVDYPVLIAFFTAEGDLLDVFWMPPHTGTARPTRPYQYALELTGRHTTETGAVQALHHLAGGLTWDTAWTTPAT